MPDLTFSHLYCLIFFAAFLILPRQMTTISHTVWNPILTHMYFAVHYSLPFYHSTLYSMIVNHEPSAINLRCPDLVTGNMIKMGDTSSHVRLGNIIPCVKTIIISAIHAITPPELLYVQFITSYYTPVLQKIKDFCDIKAWHWATWCFGEL